MRGKAPQALPVEGALNPNNCRVSDGLKKRAEEMVEPARPGIRKRELLLRKGLFFSPHIGSDKSGTTSKYSAVCRSAR